MFDGGCNKLEFAFALHGLVKRTRLEEYQEGYFYGLNDSLGVENERLDFNLQTGIFEKAVLPILIEKHGGF